MARTVPVTLNGTDYHMPVSFAVSQQIAERVGDPLQLAIESYRTGSVPLSSGQVVTVIAIGAQAAGCALSEEKIGEAIVGSDEGLIGYVNIAAAYIGAQVSGGPEKAIPTGKKKTSRPGAKS